MKQRHQLLSQSKVYLQQNPSDARLTVEQLQEMVGTMNSMQLMNRLQRYAAKIQGSKQYWYARYQELKTLLEQKGSPTFFWTVSSADNYWPELHSLMPHASNDDMTHAMRVNAVISNPHITDWFFHAKLTDFVQHFLYDTLDAEWHWYRYEYLHMQMRTPVMVLRIGKLQQENYRHHASLMPELDQLHANTVKHDNTFQ